MKFKFALLLAQFFLVPALVQATTPRPIFATSVYNGAGNLYIPTVTPSANQACFFDGTNTIGSSVTTSAELAFLHGVTSSVQTQINALQPGGSYITSLTGGVSASGPGAASATVNSVGGKTASQIATTVTNNSTDVTLGVANGLSLTGQALSLGLSSTSQPGALSSSNWNTFNGKQAQGSYLTGLSGDGTASGPGVSTFTLSTSGVSAGTYTNAHVTVDAKGRLTAASNGTAPVTSVGVSSPLTSTGGLTPTLGIQTSSASQSGALSSTDWSTFSGKQNALTFGNMVSGTSGLSVSNGANSVIGSGVSINASMASASQQGLLSSTDWSTFNSKLSGPLTGDVTTSGSVATLANTAVTAGSYTSANITVDSKGRLTSAANGSGGGGSITVGTFGSTPTANAATASGSTLTLQPADGTHPGSLTSGTQSIGGDKNLSGSIDVFGSITGGNETGRIDDTGLHIGALSVDPSGDLLTSGSAQAGSFTSISNGSFMNDAQVNTPLVATESIGDQFGSSVLGINQSGYPISIYPDGTANFAGKVFLINGVNVGLGNVTIDTSGNINANGAIAAGSIIADGSNLTGYAPGFNVANADNAFNISLSGTGGSFLFNNSGNIGYDYGYTDGAGHWNGMSSISLFSGGSISTDNAGGMYLDGSGTTQNFHMASNGVVTMGSNAVTLDPNGSVEATQFLGAPQFYLPSGGAFYSDTAGGVVYNNVNGDQVLHMGAPGSGNPQLSFFGAALVVQQSGDVGTALVNYGLMATATTNASITMTNNNTATATFNTSTVDETIYDTSATLAAALTIALPSTTRAGQTLTYVSNRVVTTVTVTGTVSAGPALTTFGAAGSAVWRATNTTGTFVRVQ